MDLGSGSRLLDSSAYHVWCFSMICGADDLGVGILSLGWRRRLGSGCPSAPCLSKRTNCLRVGLSNCRWCVLSFRYVFGVVIDVLGVGDA